MKWVLLPQYSTEKRVNTLWFELILLTSNLRVAGVQGFVLWRNIT